MDTVPSARIVAVALGHIRAAKEKIGSGTYSHQDARYAARSIDVAMELLTLVAVPSLMPPRDEPVEAEPVFLDYL